MRWFFRCLIREGLAHFVYLIMMVMLIIIVAQATQ